MFHLVPSSQFYPFYSSEQYELESAIQEIASRRKEASKICKHTLEKTLYIEHKIMVSLTHLILNRAVEHPFTFVNCL